MNDFSALGEQLKNTRTKMGLSLSEVSSMTGVSKTMLSQIERSESIPTIATVWKIANGLRIKFETLLENTNKLYEVKSIDTMIPLTDNDDHILLYCIFPFSPISGFELFYGIIKPGCNYSSENHQNSSTEYLSVSQGELELVIGANTYHIKAGSAIAFDSRKDHKYINNGEVDVIAHFVISYE
ncbi:MAG TPA: helix-turn-helix domain-containing protein [Desulfitobacterium dehalogenans]|uniref:Helix-turn-helix domain-containing protein n=1 Tax=Desulfitobacterium dehalogenans TaxID=36854 RepID=A0A7C6Z5T0_9FIRM|nr:helix-turn-helix domain-containing protein [Desulfitobacterium dehalogenans]